jgi:hypothetical protein
MKDIMNLSFFWEIQFIGHFAYSFEYEKWATILKGQFRVFSQSQATFQGLDYQKHLVTNFKFHRASPFVSIELGLFLGTLHIFFDQFQNIVHISDHFIYTFYLGNRCSNEKGSSTFMPI